MTSKDEMMKRVWRVYAIGVHSQRLGQVMRSVVTQFSTKEHKVLSSLEGECAIAYFNEHFDGTLEQQLSLEGV
jgi:hypothetical protein